MGGGRLREVVANGGSTIFSSGCLRGRPGTLLLLFSWLYMLKYNVVKFPKSYKTKYISLDLKLL